MKRILGIRSARFDRRETHRCRRHARRRRQIHIARWVKRASATLGGSRDLARTLDTANRSPTLCTGPRCVLLDAFYERLKLRRSPGTPRMRSAIFEASIQTLSMPVRKRAATRGRIEAACARAAADAARFRQAMRVARPRRSGDKARGSRRAHIRQQYSTSSQARPCHP
jgi:hypothetical protein